MPYPPADVLGWFLAAAGLASALAYIWDRFYSLHGLPSSIPWASAGHSLLARGRSSRRSLFGLRALIEEGYNTYSKHNLPFILPNLATGPEIILPPRDLKWLLDQPDAILNQNAVNTAFLAADHTMLHPHIIRDTVHGHVIRRELTKNLDSYAAAIVDEIEEALSGTWGRNARDWTDVPAYESLLRVVAAISNRVLVGLPLCRDPAYLKASATFARNVVLTAGAINLLPPFLRPLLAPLFTAYDTLQYRRLAAHIYPIVAARVSSFKPGMDYKSPDYSAHNDYVQWALHDAFSHADPAERTAEMITKRLAVLSFAAIQSSVITITNALFDIASHPDSLDIQAALRAEVTATTAALPPAQQWSRKHLAGMHALDSALRESMRLWGFIARGVSKAVLPAEGIRLPTGEHLPQGSKIGIMAWALHHDPSLYPSPYAYQPFRFADKRLSMVTSSPAFMPFSHGRHACPGRFFAANQLKLLLAHILLKYDIAPIPTRPPNPYGGGHGAGG
ncbi:cytochrome P450 [Trichodelitschia bisporula]|uniref:Cytochrome P450 n=1 Tax=Trichodelitschia bisporula TaxID=703511 RepID=A0A6G1HMP8_9PEZI|nr:cytochrome P450 [Trichodelitschia bisporula]